MCSYYEYNKCGITAKIYCFNDYFIILKGTSISSWDNNYNDTAERRFYRQFVENNFTTRDLAFQSLSSVNSFIYGKPCDIKTTTRYNETSDFNDVNRFEEAIKFRKNCSKEVKDLYYTSIREENSMEKKDIENYFSGLSLEKRLNLGCTLQESSKAEIFADIFTSRLTDAITSILNDVINIRLSKDNSINFLEPYSNRVELVDKNSEDYKKSLSILSRVFNQNDLISICDTLKYSGVYLAGEAGIGKGMIANNIGALLVEQNDIYNSYAKVFVNCHEAINIAQVSWGTGMNNVEYLGAFYTAFKYAEEHPDCAVVLVLDEINRCKWEELLGAVFELTSSKIDNSHCYMNNGVKLTYLSNIYIIATGNVGVSFKTGKIDDSGFNDRFQYIKLSGLFDSIDYIKSYSKNAVSELNTGLSEKDIFKVLEDVYYAIEDNQRVCRSVSLRKMNNLVCICKSVEEFDNGVKHLFNESTRKDLGWR